MNVDYLFFDGFEEMALTETTYRGEMRVTKALCLPRSCRVFVNLGASQWSFYYDVFGEDELLKELKKTLNHEAIHMAISYADIDNGWCDGEEYICKLLAGQL